MRSCGDRGPTLVSKPGSDRLRAQLRKPGSDPSFRNPVSDLLRRAAAATGPTLFPRKWGPYFRTDLLRGFEAQLREVDPAVPDADVLHALVHEAFGCIGDDAGDRPGLVESGGELGRELGALSGIPGGGHRVE